MRIRLEGLNKKYNGPAGTVEAVHDVSLDIPSNTIYGIIGKSGAGKSSLVRLISLLEQPDSGNVFYGEDRVDNLGKAELIAWHRRIGMIFQNFNLFSSRTAAKNIAYPLEISGCPKSVISKRVKELLELVDLADRGNSPVSTLSGGQKQRVAIARALANHPDILFCDEATSALDPQTTRSILELIRNIQKKMNLTVVMITHQMEVVRDACEYVAVLEKGCVVEQGKVADVFSNPRTETTRDFLRHLSSNSGEPEASVVHWANNSAEYVLSFKDNLPDRPLFCQAIRKFDVEVNFTGGGINVLADNSKVGVMYVDIKGDRPEVEGLLEFFRTEGVGVEKL